MSMETKDRRSGHIEPNREVGYERRDANIRSMLEFGFWLAMVLVVTLFAMKLAYHYFAKMEPVGAPASPFMNVREIPAGPLLQATPHVDLQTYCEDQQQQVNTYGWVDQQAGVVRLPVDRAMDLILERGLPTRAASQAPPGSSAEAEAPFLPVTQDAQGQCSFVEDQRISEAPIE